MLPIVTLNQDSDTPARREIAPCVMLTYLYDRSRDSKKSGAPGQDFIAFSYDHSRVAFAVCDGVSQSFYGDLAARFLGEKLVAWLMAHTAPVGGDFADQLDRVLRAWTGEASQLVQARQPAADLPPMIREALERKRENGSESMFVAGLLDLSGEQLVVCWMGDMRLWLWDSHTRPVDLPGAVWLTKERWSTRIGPKNGVPRTAILNLDDVARLTIHTDGVGNRAQELRSITRERLDQLARELGAAPASDDVSILDIVVDSVDVPPLDAPEPYVPDMDEPVIRWQAVDGAQWYRVEMIAAVDGRQWTADTTSTSFILPPGQPEPTDCRVQALSSDHRPSVWSDSIRVGRELVMPVLETGAPAMPTAAEAEPIVNAYRPFRTDVILVGALLLALALTVGWMLIYVR